MSEPVTRLQLARDALEEDMSLGAVRPLAIIRHGEPVLISGGTSPRAKVASLRTARQCTIEEHNWRTPARAARVEGVAVELTGARIAWAPHDVAPDVPDTPTTTIT